MTDVLKIALERRSELQEEVAKLDEFIRMAEALIRSSQARAKKAAETVSVDVQPARTVEPVVRTAMRRAEGAEADEPGEVRRPSVIRRSQAS